MNNTINNIVKSNLKSNKLKSLMLIITIALTTTLLTSVGLVVDNMLKQQKEFTVLNYGSAHGYYRKLDEDQINKIRRHKDIEILGENSFQIGKNEINNLQISLMYVDKVSMDLNNMSIIKGKTPEKYNEIAMDETMLKAMGYEPKINQKINLSYYDTNKNFKEKEFILSGILPKNVSGEINGMHSVIVSKELIIKDKYNPKIKASIRIKNEDKLSQDEIKEKITEIGKSFNVDEDNIQFNEMYLMWMKPDITFIMTGIVIALVIMISSILVIYNIFYISIVNKIQEYGKLKAIGTTKRQIKSIVLKEGMILSLISIPIGLLLGSIITNVLLDSMIEISADIGVIYNVHISIPIIIGSIILTLFTVYLSLLKPMKIVSKISPVEAMRYNGSESKNKKKTRKGYINLDIAKLTKANLSRNKKRTILTLLSLSLSGILIMTASTVMGSINAENMIREGMYGDFKFNIKYSGYDYEKEREAFVKNNPLNEEFIKNIESIDGVKSTHIVRTIPVYTPNSGEMKVVEPELKEVEHVVAGCTDEMIKSLDKGIDKGKLNIDKIKSGEEVIITSRTEHWLGISAGDKIKILSTVDGKKINKEVRIQAVSNYHYGGDIITSLDLIQNPEDINNDTSLSILVDKYKEKEISKILTNLASQYKNLEFTSFKIAVENNEKALIATGSMGYALVIVIGVISLVNLINTMMTSIISRKRELGILQTIGMTDKQLLKMLKLESLFYTIITITSSLIVGSTIGYITYKIMYNTGMSYAVYKFPLIPSIILVVTMVVVQFGIGRFINNIFKKESLIDRVRYSE